MAKLKVWSGLVYRQGKQQKACCSATSAKRVAELCNAACSGHYSAHSIRAYWSNDNRNAATVDATLKHPDTLLITDVEYPTRADQWRPAEENAP